MLIYMRSGRQLCNDNEELASDVPASFAVLVETARKPHSNMITLACFLPLRRLRAAHLSQKYENIWHLAMSIL